MLQGDSRREWRLIGYSSGNFGKNIVWSTVDLTFLFVLTDFVGLPVASAALLMTIAILGDLVFDVLAGVVSAQAKAYSGGYRWLITLAAVPCGMAFTLLYALPSWGEHSFWPIAAVFLVFRAAYAIVDLPHYAMIADVASDSRARGRTAGYRSFFSNISSLIIATYVIPLAEWSARLGQATPLAVFGAAAGVAFCIAMATAAAAGAPVPPARQTDAATERFKLSVPKFPPLFLAMLGLAVVMSFAVPMFSRCAIYYATYVLGRPDLAGHILAAITFGQFGGVLVWTGLVRYFDKTKLLVASYASTLGALCFFAIAAPNEIAMLVAAAVMGIAILGIYMLPWGILPDVVDFCELRQGFRQETTFFAVFLVVHKLCGAASTGLIGWALATTGYVPGAHQSPLVIHAIVLLAFGVPIVGTLAGIVTLFPLEIGHRRHAAAIRKLAFKSSIS